MSKKPEGIPEDVINAMCLTWRHDFGLDAPQSDSFGRMAWSDGASMGMTQAQKDGLRMQMRQLYQHHVLPAILAAVEAEREACARLIDEGFDRVGIVTKHDQCPHNLYGWEDCEQCAAAAIRKRALS